MRSTAKLILDANNVHDFLVVGFVDAVVAEGIPQHELFAGLRVYHVLILMMKSLIRRD